MSYERKDVKSMDYKSLGEFIPLKMAEMVKMGENDAIKSANDETLAEFQARNEELRDARERFAIQREATKAFEEQVAEHKKSFETVNRTVPFGDGGASGEQKRDEPQAFKSLGELFTESEAYTKSAKQDLGVNGNVKADIPNVSIKSLEMDALKATMATTAGWAPYPTLAPRGPVMTALRRPVVADLVPQSDTNQPAILWYEETTFTNAAASVAEGATKPEAALATTLRTQPVVKIAVTLPITDEQLADIPQVRDYIDSRLKLMVQLAEEAALLGGNGVSPNLMGFHSKPGIGSIARGAGEDNPDAILRAITDVNSIVGFANASGVIMHPKQWLAIRLLRTTTGEYIWGHPALQGPATLWGLPVISTPAQTEGRALVGDFQLYSHISRRLGLRVDVGYINDDFTKDIQRIRLEERLSLEIYRAAAFEEVTNLNAAA